jgi:hypothetical protein
MDGRDLCIGIGIAVVKYGVQLGVCVII